MMLLFLRTLGCGDTIYSHLMAIVSFSPRERRRLHVGLGGP